MALIAWITALIPGEPPGYFLRLLINTWGYSVLLFQMGIFGKKDTEIIRQLTKPSNDGRVSVQIKKHVSAFQPSLRQYSCVRLALIPVIHVGLKMKVS